MSSCNSFSRIKKGSYISIFSITTEYRGNFKNNKLMENDEKDEYPCCECGEMVDVEDYCYNNELCSNCAQANQELEEEF